MKSLWHPGYTWKHNLKYLLIDPKDVCLEIHHNWKYKVHQVEFISSSRGWSIYGRQLKTHPTKINTILDVICSEIDIARLGVLPKGVSEGEKRQSNTSTIYKSRCCLKPCFTSVLIIKRVPDVWRVYGTHLPAINPVVALSRVLPVF